MAAAVGSGLRAWYCGTGDPIPPTAIGSLVDLGHANNNNNNERWPPISSRHVGRTIGPEHELGRDGEEAQTCLAFAQKVWHDAVVVMDTQRIDVGSTHSSRDRNSACYAYFDVNLADDESLTKGITSVLKASRVLYDVLQDAL